MMDKNLGKLFTCLMFLTCYLSINAQPIDKPNLQHSVSIGPLGDIFILQYSHLLLNNDEFIIGASYTNPGILNMIKYPGNEEIYTLELGYRKYLYKGLNIEIQLDPQYFLCHYTVENKNYNGFGLTTEIRFGYRLDFKISNLLFFINGQFFGGYHLINPKPRAFQEIDGGSYYISPIPMVFLGIKF